MKLLSAMSIGCLSIVATVGEVVAATDLHARFKKDVAELKNHFTVEHVATQSGHAMVKVLCSKDMPIVMVGDNGSGTWMSMSGDDSLTLLEDVKQTCETMALVKSMGMPGMHMNQHMQAMLDQHKVEKAGSVAGSVQEDSTPTTEVATSTFRTPEFKQQLSADVEATQHMATASISDKQQDYWAIAVTCHSGRKIDLFFDFNDGYLYNHKTERSGMAHEGPVSTLAFGLCSSQ